MSAWHDIVSSQPPDAQLVLVRRSPGDCPPLAATWDARNARCLCGPEQWALPWRSVCHWRAPAAPPAWPQPRNGASPWQDIYLCPPGHEQSVWLRRYGDESAAFRAVFDRANRVFTLPNGWQIQWYQAARWRAA
jgi:hypothetical protein